MGAPHGAGEYCDPCAATLGGTSVSTLTQFQHLPTAREWLESVRARAPIGPVEKEQMLRWVKEMGVHHADVRVGGVVDGEVPQASVLHVRMPRNPVDAAYVVHTVREMAPDETVEEMPGIYRLYFA